MTKDRQLAIGRELPECAAARSHLSTDPYFILSISVVAAGFALTKYRLYRKNLRRQGPRSYL